MTKRSGRGPASGRKQIETDGKKGIGIKGRLMLSFGLVAMTTVLAGGIGLLSYDRIQSASLKVTDDSVPAMANAFNMVEQATGLRSLASTMAGASDPTEYAAATNQLASRRETMESVLEGIAQSAMPKEKRRTIETLTIDLFNALGDLSHRVDDRLRAAEQRSLAVTAIAEDHSRLTDWLTPKIDDAGFELVIETESTTESLGNQIENLMSDGVNRLQSALTLRADVNLLAGILIEAAVAQDVGTLEAASDRFVAAKASIADQLTMLNGESGSSDLEQPISALIAMGDGPAGVFPVQRESLTRRIENSSTDPLDWAKRIYGPREAILNLLEPLVDEASFDLIILSESAVKDNAKTISELIDHSVGNLQGLLGIAAEANWLVGLLQQASMEQDRAAIGPLVDQINAVVEHFDVYRDVLHLSDEDEQELDSLLQPLLARTAGPEAIVDMRTAELDVWTKQEAAVELTDDLSLVLTEAVNELVELAYTDVRENGEAVQNAIANGRWLLITLSLASLMIAVAVVTLYVGPNIIVPLGKISRCVGRLARGDQVAVPGVDRQDELGKLARSLGVIHEQAVEASRIKLALDSADSPVMVTDATHKVMYVNTRLVQVLALAEGDLRQDVPDFFADRLIGEPLDFVYRLKSDFKTTIEGLNGPCHESLTIGDRHLSFVASPVRGPNGGRLGTVLQWQDETDERKLRQAISSVVQAASVGDFSKRVDAVGVEGTMAELAGGINHLAQLVDGATTDLGLMLASLAKGDLTRRIHKTYQGALGELKDNANQTADQLSDIVAQIQAATQEVGNAATEISSGTGDLSQRTEQAAANLEETAASTEQMAATVQQNAGNAKSANELANAASQAAENGGDIVKQAVDAMGDIESSAERISSIVGVIDEIAFQTNLLALNASVEAARAGEAGKGFAVVAQEVRQLAQRSAQAASDIKVLIEGSNEQVNGGAQLVKQTGKALEDIVNAIKKVTAIVGDITSASEEQSIGVQEINRSIGSMDEMTQQNSALVEESTAAARALNDQTTTLKSLIAYFNVDDPTAQDATEAKRPELIAS